MQLKEIESCEIVVKSYAKINIFLKIVGKTQIKGVFLFFMILWDSSLIRNLLMEAGILIVN